MFNPKTLFKNVLNYHQSGEKPDILLFSTPRSGSTWLMELMCSQKGMKFCNEPFNVRHADIRKKLNMPDWPSFYEQEAKQRIETYFRSLMASGFNNNIRGPHLLNPYYEITTNRIVFKILHAGEADMVWFGERFNSQIVYLLRHPIPVSLSRDKLPRLDSFLNSPFRENFNQEQLKYADHIYQRGSFMQKAMLDWCLQNTLPLKHAKKEWNIVTYEQLVIQPEPVLNSLVHHLQLEDAEAIRRQLPASSKSTRKSTQENKKTLEKLRSKNDRSLIIKKWKNKISETEEKQLMEPLPLFDIHAYQAGDILPRKELWTGQEYEHALS